jgi:DNA-binding response OmpR family regulator
MEVFSPSLCPFTNSNEDYMAKILIAEDERDIRDLVAFTLRFAGHEVFTATNGEEAVELAPQVNPDLVLMDVRMPRMTGYEACRALKANSELKDIPVVFLSAKGQESEIQQGLEAGAEEYLLKPFAPDQLTNRVKAILGKFGK